MFGKRQDCPRCKSRVKLDFDFCPHCGCDIRNPEKDLQDYGLLGKNELSGAPVIGGGSLGTGITDKLLASILNQLFKSMDIHVQQSSGPEATPNGIKFQIGVPQAKPASLPKLRKVSDDQVKRMAGVPRVEAKADIRRLTDKVVYELKAPGINALEDVFVSKVESGYEVKAIGKKKVYINSLQVDLPLQRYTLHTDGITLEFGV